MNNDWDGWRMGRIELHKEGEKYAVYEGFICLPAKAFQALREELDWKEFDKLPDKLKTIIKFIEKQAKTSVGMVSVGPDREQTILT